MRVSEPTIGALVGIITGKGEVSGPARTSKPLINFFNRFGLRKPIVDMLPSKWDFAHACLLELNGTAQLKACIEETLDYRLYAESGASSIQDVVRYLSSFLEYDGYKIEQEQFGRKYSIKPLQRQKQHNQVVALTSLQKLAQSFDYPHILEVVQDIENDIDKDPRQAIGSSKELVETVCKTILGVLDKNADLSMDVQPLVKATLKVLKLVPDNIPNGTKGEDQIKKIINAFSTITHNMAELRNLFGSGHGRDGKWIGLQPRHARLTVGASTALAMFLFDTFQERGKE